MSGVAVLALALSAVALAIAVFSLLLALARARYAARFHRSLWSGQDARYREAEERQLEADADLYGYRRAHELAFERDLQRSSRELRAVYCGSPPVALLAAALKREAAGG